MKFYENCRNFDPSYKKKAVSIDIATQHWRFGYHSFSKNASYQRLLKFQYEKYVKETQNIDESPESIIDWWKAKLLDKSYKALASLALRGCSPPRGGLDIERSFVTFSRLNKQEGAEKMAPVTKETKVMARWNKELIALNRFNCRL